MKEFIICILCILLIFNLFAYNTNLNKAYASGIQRIDITDTTSQTCRYDINTNNLVITNKSDSIESIDIQAGYVNINFKSSSVNVKTIKRRFTFDKSNRLRRGSAYFSPDEDDDMQMYKYIPDDNLKGPVKVIQLGNLWLQDPFRTSNYYDKTSYISSYNAWYNSKEKYIGITVVGDTFPGIYHKWEHRTKRDYFMWTTILEINQDIKTWNGFIEYTYNTIPSINLTSPINKKIYSEVLEHNQLAITGTAYDSNIGDNLTIKYTLNNGSDLTNHTNKTLKTLTANGNNQSFKDNITINDAIPAGTYTLKVWAEDGKGGKSPVVNRTVQIDKTQPNGSIIGNPVNWQNTDATLTVNATDGGSGVKRIKKPNGVWISSSTTTYTVNTNGIYNFIIEDNVGNQKTIDITIDKIDKEAPQINISNITDGKIYQDSITPVFNATDVSNVNVTATLNGAPYFSGTPITTGGNQILSIIAIDEAGNQAKEIISFYINKNPEITLTTADDQVLSENEGFNEINISGTISDNNVGSLITVKYSIQDSKGALLSGHDNRLIQDSILADATTQNFKDFAIRIDDSIPEDRYTLKVWTEDNEGGKSSEITRLFTVDKTGPTIISNRRHVTALNTYFKLDTYAIDTANPYNDVLITFNSSTLGISGDGIFKIDTDKIFVNQNINSIFEEGEEIIIHVEATDKVGNKSFAIIKIKIDSTGNISPNNL